MVIMNIEGVEPHYQIIVDRAGHGMDTLEVQVEVNEKMFSDEIKALEQLEQRITKEINSVLGIGVKVTLVEPKKIARSEGKAKRIVDKRKILNLIWNLDFGIWNERSVFQSKIQIVKSKMIQEVIYEGGSAFRVSWQ